MKKIFTLLFLAFTLAVSLQAQVKIGDNPATINSGSLLEMESTNKGLLYPRVDLSTLTANTLATFGLLGSSPTDGMTVFNTVVSSNFKIGLYIWQNSTWNIVNSTATPGNDKNIYEGNGTLTGNRTVTQAGRTLAFTATASNAFSVDGATFSVDAANNRVGVGTNTPSEKFTVGDGSTLASNAMAVQNSLGLGRLGIASGVAAYGANVAGDLILNNQVATGGIGLVLAGSSSGAAPNLYLAPTGKVGIGGVGTPTEALDVNGNLKFFGALMPNNLPGASGDILTSAGAGINPTWVTPTAANSQNIYTADGTLTGARTVTMAGNSLSFNSTTATTLSLNSSANVPMAFNVSNTSGTGRLAIASATGDYGAPLAGDIMINSNTAGKGVGISTTGFTNAALYVANDGKVGIGMGSSIPTSTLEVGNISTPGNLIKVTSAGGNSSYSGVMVQNFNNNQNAGGMFYNEGGLPGVTAGVGGPLGLHFRSSYGLGNIFGATVPTALYISAATSATDASKVGIGTTSPTQSLQVGDNTTAGNSIKVLSQGGNSSYSGVTVGNFNDNSAGGMFYNEGGLPGVTAGVGGPLGLHFRASYGLGNIFGATVPTALYISGATSATDASKVGIGTTAPTSQLHIVDPVANGVGLLLSGSYGGISQGVRFNNTLTGGALTITPGYDYSGVGVPGVSATFDIIGAGDFIFGDNIIPETNGSRNLGNGSRRYANIFLVNSPNVSSDARLKKNIVGVKYGLNDVLKMRPVTYNLKDDAKNETQIGFIAQEMLEVVPEIVTLGNKVKEEEPMYAMKYEQLIPVLTKAIQEQQVQIEALQKAATEKDTKIAALQVQATTMVSRTEYDELKAMVVQLLTQQRTAATSAATDEKK